MFKAVYTKALNFFTEYPLAFYAVGLVIVGVVAYATGIDCKENHVACMLLVVK